MPLPARPHRTSNAGPINVKDVFDVTGGVSGVSGGHVNQAYEPVLEVDERDSLRLAPRNHQVQWSGSK